MKRPLTSLLGVALLAFCQLALAQSGFILRAGDGEELFGSIVIKLSPNVGTSGPILAEQTFELGMSTSLHAHDQGDEIFYVVSGRGSVTLEDRTEVVGPGDVIFVPPGEAHEIGNPVSDEPLVVLFFMATPELAQEMRAIHEFETANPDRETTPEEIEAIRRIYGGQRQVTE